MLRRGYNSLFNCTQRSWDVKKPNTPIFVQTIQEMNTFKEGNISMDLSELSLVQFFFVQVSLGTHHFLKANNT